jgi:hypothetical protein
MGAHAQPTAMRVIGIPSRTGPHSNETRDCVSLWSSWHCGYLQCPVTACKHLRRQPSSTDRILTFFYSILKGFSENLLARTDTGYVTGTPYLNRRRFVADDLAVAEEPRDLYRVTSEHGWRALAGVACDAGRDSRRRRPRQLALQQFKLVAEFARSGASTSPADRRLAPPARARNSRLGHRPRCRPRPRTSTQSAPT